jgi:hypothetical protein
MSIFDAVFDTIDPTIAQSIIENRTRKPYPQFNSLRPHVIEELTRRKNSYPVITNSPFVRLTSCRADKILNYRFFSMGLHGFDTEAPKLFDLIYGSGQGDIVGYVHDTITKQKKLITADQLTLDISPPITDRPNVVRENVIRKNRKKIQELQQQLIARGAHPIPGITHIDVTRRGLGVPVVSYVKFVCYNRSQLEFIRNHFMIVGGYVVLEWGQQFADFKCRKILDFNADDILEPTGPLIRSLKEGRGYVIDNWITQNNGNYEFQVGRIGNFVIGYNAHTQIYECSVDILSSGENPWGLNTHQSVVNLSETADVQQVTTIDTYFKPGNAFDVLVAQHQHDTDPDAVCTQFRTYFSTHEQNRLEKLSDIKNNNTNPDDYYFISWNFFINTVIPDLINNISHPEGKKDSTITFASDKVGNNDFLFSTEPDTMILYRQDMANAPNAFKTIGAFDDTDDPKKEFGTLNKGVWLNTGAIRMAFQGTNNFMKGMFALLTKMNNAVANYWQLMLFYDEENGGKYIIVDNKATDMKEFPNLYKFNMTNRGELIELNMNTGFPPELITQMMLYAQFKNEGLKGRELLNKYPLLGYSSTFIFSLNWTNLVDLLDQEMTNILRTAKDDPNINVESIDASQKDEETGQNEQLTARLGVAGGSANASVVKKDTIAHAGKPLSAFPDLNSSPSTTSPLTFRISNSPVPPITKKSLLTDIPGFDFSKYSAIIGNAESGGSYSAENTKAQIFKDGTKGPPTAALGKYQFLPKRLFEYGYLKVAPNLKSGLDGPTVVNNSGNWTGKDGIFSKQDFLNRPDIQDKIFLSFTQANYASLIKLDVIKPNLSNANEISGLLASAHLVGPGGAKSMVTGDNKFDIIDSNLTPAQSYYKLGHAAQDTVTSLTNIVGSGTIPQTALDNAQQSANSINSQTVQGQNAKQIESVIRSYAIRFGNTIMGIIKPDRAAMVNEISRDGFKNYPKINSFVAPIPTMTSITLKSLGIAGISITDGFLVDKLPFVFNQYGCFQITEINQHIDISGWYTTVDAMFRMLWIDGEGPPEGSQPITQLTRTDG